MSAPIEGTREGNLEAPTRHPLDWKSEDFWSEESLNKELERVFDICHGCRRCVSLCNAFPTLFDLVDESETMEVDGVAKDDYGKVVEHCYLCDLCYMTKCPYVPPHPWNLDFPHLMLRAKAVDHRKNGASLRDRVLTSPDRIGKLAGIPVVAQAVNAANRSKAMRRVLHKTLKVDPEAPVPPYEAKPLTRRLKHHASTTLAPVPAGRTRGKVALFGTCYGTYNEPHLGEDLVAVFEHNGIPVVLAQKVRCCGMPKLELGDLDSVEVHKNHNIVILSALVDSGYDIVAPIPSCVLMFKQELPLMFPDDPLVAKVKAAMFDPFEYLALRHRDGKLSTDFKVSLGKVAYHPPCHQRVQNIGPKTREILNLVEGTEVETIERCSGHDGTYAVKSEYRAAAVKIGRPVATRVKKAAPDHFGSDCPMAGHQIESLLGDGKAPEHPLTLLRLAYGI
jgi:Fe-S oxidoreductase